MKNNLNKVLLTGTNNINVINKCLLNGLNIVNIKKVNNKSVEFEISDKDYCKLKNLDLNCKIELIKYGGKKLLLHKFLAKIGFISGLIISLLAIFLLNNRLLQIHISGLINVDKKIVIEKLSELGVNKFTYMNYDLNEIESKLSKEFKFSLVSIITRGNSLIINVKEELPDIKDSYVAITADYNMVINSINVYSGTSMVKSGDIVYKGDVLVEPYIQSGQDIVYVSPCAEIDVTVFFSESYLFRNSEECYVRTGKKQLISISCSIGKWNIYNKDYNCKYAYYDSEEKLSNVSNNFIPLEIRKIYAFELEKVLVERNFDSEKDKLLNDLKNSAYQKLSSNIKVDKEEISITEIDNGYILNFHLITNLKLKYS